MVLQVKLEELLLFASSDLEFNFLFLKMLLPVYIFSNSLVGVHLVCFNIEK